jgi:L-aminopeptidase/D-esterase-like protein
MPVTSIPFTELSLRVGHWTHPDGGTGCTVILPPVGTVASGEVRGAAPGTRETDVLRPGGLVGTAHALLLTGGSAFGLAAADGVMRYLRERRIGYAVGETALPVPIVPAAVIYDVGAVDGTAPDADAGYAACRAAASHDGPVPQGRIGAGAGARVGRIAGHAMSSPGGVGVAALRAGELIVGALMVVNAFGEVRDPATGQIMAGVRMPGQPGFVPTLDLLTPTDNFGMIQPRLPGMDAPFNTVIGVVATNAPLDQTALATVARMANAGLARAITPTHSMFDGDTIFTLALPRPARERQMAEMMSVPAAIPHPVVVSQVGALAAEAVIAAILTAVRA